MSTSMSMTTSMSIDHDHEHDHEHEHHHEHDRDHDHDHEHDMNTTMTTITTTARDAPADATTTIITITTMMQMKYLSSWGKETPHKYTKEKIESILKIILRYGRLRQQFCVQREWFRQRTAHGSTFDMVPGEYELRDGEPDYTGRLCVIGTRHRRAQVRGTVRTELDISRRSI